MLKGLRSRSKRDSKRSKGKLDASDSDLNVDTDPVSPSGAISKHDLKEEWRLSGLSRDVGEFARRLLDHLVEGQDATTPVNGELYTAFQKTVTEMQNDPTRQPQLGGTGLEGRGRQSWLNTETGETEGDEQESTQGSEAEQEEGSYCAQADENDSDEQVQPRMVQQETQGRKNRKRCRAWCSFLSCRLVMSFGLVVALSICALHFTELENKIAEIVMNNPYLSAQWDALGGKSIRILVTGKTGTGKSALINGLMGQKVAVEGDTLNPETSEVQQIKRMVQGVSMSIFDSPGLQDGTKREYEYMKDMQRKCRSVDLVLYTIRMTDQRVHAEDTRAMKKLTKAFGVEFWNRAIFVLTFANEVQDSVDPEDEIKTEAYFKKRLEIWKENLPELVEEREAIPTEIVRRIPIIPVGYYNIRDLPGQKYWFTQFWLAALNRMKEAGANGAGYMLEFSKDRIKTSDQTTEQDFEKPIYEQPIVYDK